MIGKHARSLRGLEWSVPMPDVWSDPVLADEGATEPWTVKVLESLVVALGAECVVEIGVSVGYTAMVLCHALARMGGGRYIGFEPEGRYAATARERLATVPPGVSWHIYQERSPAGLVSLDPQSVDLAFVDGEHTSAALTADVDALRRLMVSGGLICAHDVVGYELEDTWTALGGYILRLPQRVSSGGLGILQV